MDPRLKIGYLVALGVALFAVPGPVAPVFPAGSAPTLAGLLAALADPWGTAAIAGMLALQPAIALIGRLGLAPLARATRMLGPLLAILTLSYALVGPPGTYVARLPLGPLALPWSPDGLVLGLLTAARVLALVWGSVLVQHSGRPGELVRGLRGVGMPRMPALALDVSLGLLGSDAGPDARAPGPPPGVIPGSGMGRGIPGSGIGPGGPGGPGGAGTTIKQILAGDLGILLRPLEMRLRQAERRAAEVAPDLEPGAARDLALIAGLAVLSQSIRFLKILPGIPFAPGHKSVVLLPLYIVAADRTEGRWGSTALGTTNGLLAVSFGDGQWGVLEIFKFIAPGLAVDLLWSIARGRGAIAYAALGLVAAIARFATIAAVALLVQAPAVFWAMLAPIGLFHLVFGAGSGFVTYHLLRALGPEPAVPIS